MPIPAIESVCAFWLYGWRWNDGCVGAEGLRDIKRACVQATVLHVISVIQCDFHILYFPESDTKNTRNLYTFIMYILVILFTCYIFAWAEIYFFLKWINISSLSQTFSYLSINSATLLKVFIVLQQRWGFSCLSSWKYWLKHVNSAQEESLWENALYSGDVPLFVVPLFTPSDSQNA